MATRAIIQLEDYNLVKVYKHWDGYPEATLPWLEAFNKRFVEKRGDDDEYKLAQLLRSSAFDAPEFKLDDSRDTGWGIVGFNVSCGADYCYILMKDGTVKVIEK